jgi:peptidoglycan/LPS O-acetylase OafA/YrhL
MSKTERRLTYLPDIDGLRAMAVLAAVLAILGATTIAALFILQPDAWGSFNFLCY